MSISPVPCLCLCGLAQPEGTGECAGPTQAHQCAQRLQETLKTAYWVKGKYHQIENQIYEKGWGGQQKW